MSWDWTLGEKREDRCLEVHGAVGQVVLTANVADLLGLHSFEFGTVSDPMAKASTEGTAPFSWGEEKGQKGLRTKFQALDLDSRWPYQPGLVSWNFSLSALPAPRHPAVDWGLGPCSTLTSNVQHGLIPTV